MARRAVPLQLHQSNSMHSGHGFQATVVCSIQYLAHAQWIVLLVALTSQLMPADDVGHLIFCKLYAFDVCERKESVIFVV